MRVVFMGTPEFAVPSLSALADAYEVVLVLTRPDAVRARGKELEPSPVKARALELGLPVLETSRITPEALEAVREAGPDVIAVAAYGCILPDSILDVAPLGCVNVHASLLPRWRGAAPIQRAVLAGDRRAGISIMRVVHELDAGAWC
ncbi:MAG: methionyl-tRNA formyltransferase, partial [Atopobiaceae bacterium]|nr:methionyl-tRNA formyltransferase [Atopobiaceae bacterium]